MPTVDPAFAGMTAPAYAPPLIFERVGPTASCRRRQDSFLHPRQAEGASPYLTGRCCQAFTPGARFTGANASGSAARRLETRPRSASSRSPSRLRVRLLLGDVHHVRRLAVDADHRAVPLHHGEEFRRVARRQSYATMRGGRPRSRTALVPWIAHPLWKKMECGIGALL